MFFDGTYAVALTLLVTTLDGTNTPGAWADLAALWAAVGTEIVAFFLAFAIVAFYWRATRLNRSMAMLALIADTTIRDRKGLTSLWNRMLTKEGNVGV